MDGVKIQFLGGAGTVTGSKMLIEGANKQILVDCGLFQGNESLELRNYLPPEFPPEQLDTIIITHAHLDHCGYLPVLVKNGFAGNIHLTHPSAQLAKIVLLDSAKIQEQEWFQMNKKSSLNMHSSTLLYNTLDAENTLIQFIGHDLSKWIDLFDDIKFQFHNSGHILGSAMVELQISKQRLLFTGDLGRTSPILMQPKSEVESADYLILESTYGDRAHPDENASEVLRQHIEQTIHQGGQLLIPSFAIERTQEILRLLVELRSNGFTLDLPIYLDSPMASAANEVYRGYESWMSPSGKQFLDAFSFVQVITDFRQTLRLAKDKRPKIIIAGSGMLEGGRMLYYLSKQLQKRNNTLLFVGFQAEGTLGRKLINGAKKVELFNQLVEVKCSIQHINALSAHADFAEISEWLNCFKKMPKEVYLNHGEPNATNAFKHHLENTLGWHVTIPELGQAFLLDPS